MQINKITVNQPQFSESQISAFNIQRQQAKRKIKQKQSEIQRLRTREQRQSQRHMFHYTEADQASLFQGSAPEQSRIAQLEAEITDLQQRLADIDHDEQVYYERQTRKTIVPMNL